MLKMMVMDLITMLPKSWIAISMIYNLITDCGYTSTSFLCGLPTGSLPNRTEHYIMPTILRTKKDGTLLTK